MVRTVVFGRRFKGFHGFSRVSRFGLAHCGCAPHGGGIGGGRVPRQVEAARVVGIGVVGRTDAGDGGRGSGSDAGGGPSAPAASSAPADPRMAVARERAATVRVDQATAVFSTRALTDGAVGTGVGGSSGSGGSLGSDGSSGSERSGDAGTEGAESGSPGDARLRAAVAAWVAGADTDPDAEESSGDAEGGAPTRLR